jgi:hypothetical protein
MGNGKIKIPAAWRELSPTRILQTDIGKPMPFFVSHSLSLSLSLNVAQTAQHKQLHHTKPSVP